jgi:hypothetical protein
MGRLLAHKWLFAKNHHKSQLQNQAAPQDIPNRNVNWLQSGA